MAAWTTHCIGEVLKKTESWVTLDPNTRYQEVTVRLWGKGVIARGGKLGSEIGSSRRLRVEPGQFVVSRIDARHGAFGLVPEELDGAVVTNDFPVFEPNPELLDNEFLGWLSKTPGFVDACKTASEGTTNRVRLKEDRFASLEIELPPIDEQHRIVTKIESLATKIDEAMQLRQAIQDDMDALLVAMAHRNDLSDTDKRAQGWERLPLGDVLSQVSNPVAVEPGGEYPHFGIYSFAKGLFKKAPLLGDEIKAAKLYQVYAGQFIYSRLKAFEGAFGAVSPEYSGCYVSNEFPTFVLNDRKVNLAFLTAYTLSPQVWKNLAVHSKGVGARRERLKPESFLAENIWLPPLEWQLKIERVTKDLAAARVHRTSVDLDVDALLPAILDRAFKGEL